MLMSA